jgi:hypothetical protein
VGGDLFLADIGGLIAAEVFVDGASSSKPPYSANPTYTTNPTNPANPANPTNPTNPIYPANAKHTNTTNSNTLFR